MKTNAKFISAPCNQCGSSTDHAVLKTRTRTDRDEEFGAWWETRHRMIECMGCHFISLERIVMSSECEEPDVEYFPPPISRRKPAWANDFIPVGPQGMEALLNEVYAAIQANSRRLGTMGARALLDMVMTDKVKDVGGFAQKLDALERDSYISKKKREFLQAALDAGNAASHRGHCPTSRELNQVMDIVECVIEEFYVLPDAAEQLKLSTPKRRAIKAK